MNKLQQRIRLLMLFSIYFIYRALASFYLENNPSMAVIWGIITITYIISLVIMIFVAKNWQNRMNIEGADFK